MAALRYCLAVALLVGVSLMLAGCGSTPTRSTPRAHPPAHPHPHPPAEEDYVVRPGDTLYSIAFRNQLDYHDLANWNGIGRDYLIHVGQHLALHATGIWALPRSAPAKAGAPAAGPVPVPRGNSAAPPSRPPPAPTPVGGTVTGAAAGSDAGDTPAEAASGPIGVWRWPTAGEVAQTYAPDDGRKGIDIRGEVGQAVMAAAAGKVVYSGSALKGYGELVIIKHNEDYLSAYGYNRRRLVQEGQQVAAGQAIAELGLGPEQQPLLHFEIRNKGRPLNPLSLLPKR